ncbi:MAG: hypothetical protein MMC23_003042 [Stictis urceolatum]|nr:hypothetical protein [Stictis urceolata]
MTTTTTTKKNWHEGSAWSEAAEQYASYVESFTTQAVKTLVKETAAALPFGDASNTSVLDDGCGSGSVSAYLASVYPDTPILATDIAEGMVKQVDLKKLPNVRTKVSDSLNLSTLGEDGKDNKHTHVMSTFMVQFTPDVTQSLREMHRVLKPGGVLGLATWGKIDVSHVLFPKAGLNIDPNWKPAGPFEEEWPMYESSIKERLISLGFVDVNVFKVKMPYGMDKQWLKTYPIDSENPSTDNVIEYWIKSGRMDEFRAEYAKVVDALDDVSGLGAEGVLAIARKA